MLRFWLDFSGVWTVQFFLIWMDGVSFGIVSFSRCYAFLFTGILFLYCAPSSGEIWNLLAAFSVYVFFAMGR
jgi:hypothetical protein